MTATKLEDAIERGLMIGLFGLTLLAQFQHLVGMVEERAITPHWELSFVARLLSTLFIGFVVYFTIVRSQPRRTLGGIEPRVSAIMGTCSLMGIAVVEGGNTTTFWIVVSILLMIAGTGLSILCLGWLGRSFSILASARDLVTTGPYAVVRHPLYAAEAITALGVIIANWSPGAVLIGLVHFAFQFRRMHNEEQVLRQEFPAYGEYARKVPMILPRLANA
jgi:protein-S-isoprenylcysteine O-methyltransferase Ste14